MKTLSLPHRHGLKITAIYFLVAGCWIFFSDRLLSGLIEDSDLLVQFQTYKGLFFVLVTSGLLYYLINRSTSSILKGRDRLEELLEEKQILISEIHHRVKNNLSIITGLIELQTANLDEGSAEALRETQYRIYTLANIQELLYQQGNLANIPFHKCMNQLVSSLDDSSNHQSKVQAEIDQIHLNINQAVPLGLLINEILLQFKINGYRKSTGSIQIELKLDLPNRISLQLWLDEVPDKTLTRLTDSRHIEATLVGLYTKQLKATSKWRANKNGGKFKLEFERSSRPGSSSSLAKAV